jgi:hypothetical protein
VKRASVDSCEGTLKFGEGPWEEMGFHDVEGVVSLDTAHDIVEEFTLVAGLKFCVGWLTLAKAVSRLRREAPACRKPSLDAMTYLKFSPWT